MNKYTRREVNIKTHLHGCSFYTAEDVGELSVKLMQLAIEAGADDEKLAELVKRELDGDK